MLLFYILCFWCIFTYKYVDASGNPVTEVVISVTDSNGNMVTGKIMSYIFG